MAVCWSKSRTRDILNKNKDAKVSKSYFQCKRQSVVWLYLNLNYEEWCTYMNTVHRVGLPVLQTAKTAGHNIGEVHQYYLFIWEYYEACFPKGLLRIRVCVSFSKSPNSVSDICVQTVIDWFSWNTPLEPNPIFTFFNSRSLITQRRACCTNNANVSAVWSNTSSKFTVWNSFKVTQLFLFRKTKSKMSTAGYIFVCWWCGRRYLCHEL